MNIPQEFQAPLIFRRPSTSMELVPDLEACRGALEGAAVAAQETGMQREYMELPTLVIGAFQRALTTKSPALIEPMRVTLTVGVDPSRTKDNALAHYPATCTWLKGQFARLYEVEITFQSLKATCAGTAIVFS